MINTIQRRLSIGEPPLRFFGIVLYASASLFSATVGIGIRAMAVLASRPIPVMLYCLVFLVGLREKTANVLRVVMITSRQLTMS